MKLRYASATDVGRKRDHNEDHVLLSPADFLFLICDGMGGHASGEVASKMAAQAIAETFRGTRPARGAAGPTLEERLRGAIEEANAKVFAASRTSIKFRGMGTTAVVAALDGGGICIAHVGDSRAYRIRDRAIERLTQDHSLFEMLRNTKGIADEGELPPTNVLLRAVGVAATVAPELRREKIRTGDGFLLCSDGLSGLIDDASMLDAVLGAPDLPRAADELIARANDAGGNDNVSVVLIQCAPG